jgi:protein-S-isoprenylcysteine O-methyltransferase Ste14
MPETLRQSTGHIISRFRVPVSLFLFGFLVFQDWKNGLVPREIFSMSNILGPVGGLLIVFGTGLRSWAAGVIRKTKQLAATGPYSLTRHPLYAGSLLIGIGFSFVLWDNAKLWVILAVAAIFYYPKIRQEEAHLANQFGDEWTDYCHNTSLLFPKHKPNLRSPWRLQQWLYNREYKALLVSATLFAVLAVIGEKFAQ